MEGEPPPPRPLPSEHNNAIMGMLAALHLQDMSPLLLGKDTRVKQRSATSQRRRRRSAGGSSSSSDPFLLPPIPACAPSFKSSLVPGTLAVMGQPRRGEGEEVLSFRVGSHGATVAWLVAQAVPQLQVCRMVVRPKQGRQAQGPRVEVVEDPKDLFAAPQQPSQKKKLPPPAFGCLFWNRSELPLDADTLFLYLVYAASRLTKRRRMQTTLVDSPQVFVRKVAEYEKSASYAAPSGDREPPSAAEIEDRADALRGVKPKKGAPAKSPGKRTFSQADQAVLGEPLSEAQARALAKSYCLVTPPVPRTVGEFGQALSRTPDYQGISLPALLLKNMCGAVQPLPQPEEEEEETQEEEHVPRKRQKKK